MTRFAAGGRLMQAGRNEAERGVQIESADAASVFRGQVTSLRRRVTSSPFPTLQSAPPELSSNPEFECKTKLFTLSLSYYCWFILYWDGCCIGVYISLCKLAFSV
jgi:hypothetical protein